MTEIPEPVRQLLAAIADTLDVPSPALGRVDEVAHRILVGERICQVQGAIRDVLAGEAALGIEWEADYLRRKADERPPTYRTLDQILEERHGGEGQ